MVEVCKKCGRKLWRPKCLCRPFSCQVMANGSPKPATVHEIDYLHAAKAFAAKLSAGLPRLGDDLVIKCTLAGGSHKNRGIYYAATKSESGLTVRYIGGTGVANT